jgi:hypothetical protein
MKAIATLLVFMGLIGSAYALTYRNALTVGITHEQVVAFWKLQMLWILGIAGTMFVSGILYSVITAARKEKAA